MISEKKFLEYKLEVQKEFARMVERILALEKALEKQALQHKSEIQQLETAIAHEKAIEAVKAAAASTPDETDEERLQREREARTANVMLQYTQDSETLLKLGFKLPGGGGQ